MKLVCAGNVPGVKSAAAPKIKYANFSFKTLLSIWFLRFKQELEPFNFSYEWLQLSSNLTIPGLQNVNTDDL